MGVRKTATMPDGRKESPYFARRNTHSPPSSGEFGPSSLRRAHSSRYFARSPASVYGSDRSLGPISGTWLSETDWTKIENGCCRSPSSSSVCQPCQSWLDGATKHFRHCSIFCRHIHQMLQETDTNENRLHGSCFKRLGWQLEQSVRHLCPQQCYLRAYATIRDWWTLRQSILGRTDKSVDEVLRDWTCKLVPFTDSMKSHLTTSSGDGEMERKEDSVVTCDEITSYDAVENRVLNFYDSPLSSNPFHPRTVFINLPLNMRISSITRMFRELPLYESINGKTKTPICRPIFERKAFHIKVVRWNYPPGETMEHTSVQSPLGLLEELFSDRPWQLLLSTILLNRTRRTQVDRILAEFLNRWSTPQMVLQMSSKDGDDLVELTSLIAPLGIKNRRAKGIVRFCKEYVDLTSKKQHDEDFTTKVAGSTCPYTVEFEFTREEILNLHHCGQYCADAYEIFIQKKWDTVHPNDHALRAFVEWKQSQRSAR